MARSVFDEEYYRRYYTNPGTAVVTPRDIDRLVRFVVHYLEFLGVPLRTVCDLGCGIGLWRRSLRRLDGEVQYTGVEVSDYLCRRYKWIRGSVVDFRSRRRYDLVVCQGVLQYLDDREVRQAIKNLSALTRGALYLEVLTREDRDNGAVDLRRTDEDVFFRPARWYRRLLDRHFARAGGGVFIPTNSKTVLYELERT